MDSFVLVMLRVSMLTWAWVGLGVVVRRPAVVRMLVVAMMVLRLVISGFMVWSVTAPAWGLLVDACKSNESNERAW